MPGGVLSDLTGVSHTLADLYGEKLTVLCLWTNGKEEDLGPERASELLSDLQTGFAAVYAEKGLRVISVNEGDTAEIVARQAQEAGATFATLLDPDGTFFAKVATEKLPRIYLLDGAGKILWFDLVYGESTREALLQAVRAALWKAE